MYKIYYSEVLKEAQSIENELDNHYINKKCKFKLDADPSKERRSIPDVVLEKEGSIVQTCNINVHVVNTDIC